MTGKEFREAVGGLVKVPKEKNQKTAVDLEILADLEDPKELVEEVGDMNKFRQIKKYLRVLARSTPADKYLLVTAL